MAKNFPPQLRTLSLESMNWKNNSSDLLIKALPSTLQNLALVAVPLGPEVIRSLSSNWPKNLRSFEIRGGELNGKVLRNMSENLPKTIEILKLESNRIDDQGLIALASQPLEFISYLSINSGHFTILGTTALNSKKRNFKTLSLISDKLDSDAISAFGSNVLPSLRDVVLSNTPISNSSFLTFVTKAESQHKISQRRLDWTEL